MKICVLQADYSPSTVDYKNWDVPRDLAPLLPAHTVDHVALNKLTTYRQLKQLASQGYDVFVNLCDGYFEWDIPSIDVMESLERLSLPYTGPTPMLYHVSKPVMKYVAYGAGVRTPAHVLVARSEDAERAVAALRYPLFVKPSHAGDSLGIDERSLVHDARELTAKVRATIEEFGETLVEEYVDGREFTVLVVAGVEAGERATALTPVEFIFPRGSGFKTYAFKTSELHPDANIPVRDAALAARLRDAAERIFHAFEGMGYARMDFRMDEHGELYFLEVNFTCSVFYRDGAEGSADYILKYDPLGQAGFAERIIAEGIARHRRRQKPWVMRGNAVSGYGIFASAALAAEAVIFRGEGRAHRIVTARHAATWSEDDRIIFHRYAYPLSGEVYAIWDADPAEWAPQNHSCEANTHFDGLNVVASRPIAAGEELTLDYAAFLNEEAEAFECNCGAASCRRLVRGSAGNSVTAREKLRRI